MARAVMAAPVLRDPALRLCAALMVLQGAIVCTFGPYVSVLAVDVFGLGDSGFAAFLVLASVVAVTGAVGVGIRTDQTANRRGIALVSAAMMVLAMGLMIAAPGPWAFVLAQGVLVPFGATMFSQLFAFARLAAATHPPERRDGIMATIRALFALPFVIVLPLWSLAFSAGAPVLAIYPACLGLALAMLALVWRFWPRDGQTRWTDTPSGLSLRAALREMAARPLALRILALGAVHAAATIYMAIIALVLVPQIGRGPADVALYVGLVAGLEVPFMLMLPALARGRDRTVMILCGAALYAVHLALMPVLADTVFLWLLVVPAAVGGAVTLTVPIAYLQDLLGARPGAGASLMALQRLAGDGIAALCFAIGTALAGYALVGLLGVAVSVAGAAALWQMDRQTR